MEEQQQPQRISTPGQPDLYLAEKKSLSVDKIVVDDHTYAVNKARIAAYKLEKLQQPQQSEVQK